MQTQNFLTTAAQISLLSETLKNEEAISVDTEFIRETTFFPKIALIQIGTLDKTWIIDPSVLSTSDLIPLLEILKEPSILKIMHAAYADQECFHWTYDMIAEPIMDTAVAAALCGMGDNIGLAKLTRDLIGINLAKGRARAKWLARPLSNELLSYAEQDVKYLVEIGNNLKAKLEVKNRLEWAYEESLIERTVFEESPESIASRIGKNQHMDTQGLPILIELVRWRENRAQNINIPRGWVADNDVLLSLSKVRPRTLEELRTFRGLNAKEINQNGEKIIQAIQIGEKRAPVVTQIQERRSLISAGDANHIVDFIQTYIAYLAEHLKIASRFLMTGSQAEQLVYHGMKDSDQWVVNGILSKRAYELIGNDLKGLLSGKKALAVKENKLQILEV